MPQMRLSMRKIREVLRFAQAGLSARQIAASVGIARSSVAECLRRASAAGLSWPLPDEWDDALLSLRLYPPAKPSGVARPAIDFSAVQRELRRRDMTLYLLWQEYKERNPEGYQYSRYCDLYRDWLGKVDVVMRQEHRAGEKMFVDYAGQTVAVLDRHTGEIRQAQIFVAVLGASNYCFAEATWTQSLPDWLGSHVRALEFIGGCPSIVVPDNLRSGVARACRYEPDVNPSYQQWSDHYGVAVIPARVRKPRDKSKVESGVQLVQRFILARLRHETFFSLEQLNREIARLLRGLNDKAFRKLPGSRASQFKDIDQPALRPLPAARYEFAEWVKVRVNIDYHVAFDDHYYSVPYALAGQSLELRVTATTVECLHRGKRVASHVRSAFKHRHTTINEHMPSHHRHHAEWTPERLTQWANNLDPRLATVVSHILKSRRHPEQGFRAALGVLGLNRRFGIERLRAACDRAIRMNAISYRSIDAILKNGLDRQSTDTQSELALPAQHDNLRGAAYFH
jgi:transposase